MEGFFGALCVILAIIIIGLYVVLKHRERVEARKKELKALEDYNVSDIWTD